MTLSLSDQCSLSVIASGLRSEVLQLNVSLTEPEPELITIDITIAS